MVYELPDASISKIWQHESGEVIRISRMGGGVWLPCGLSSLALSKGKPVKGRWMPWTAPVFPREKMPHRLARILRNGITYYAVYNPRSNIYTADNNMIYSGNDVTNVVWLSPEYKDETCK